MEYWIEKLWRKFGGQVRGRLFVAALAGGVFSALSAAHVHADLTVGVFVSLGAAVIGLVAVGLLEWRDHDRSRSLEWRQQVESTARKIRKTEPQTSPADAEANARSREEQRFIPFVWVGMAIGGISALFGFMAFFRSL